MYRKVIAVCMICLFCFSAFVYTQNTASAQDLESGLSRDYIASEDGIFFKFGFVDAAGNIKIPYIYDYAESFSCGYALVRKGDKLYFIDENNKPAFGSDTSEYTFSSSFSEGLCVAEKDGKYGYIGTDGKVVIDLAYDEAYSFSEGLAAVGMDSKLGYIDKDGKLKIGYQYTDAGTFQDGYAMVSVNGRYGYICTDGTQVVPVIYEAAFAFSEGLARVRLYGKYTYTDQNGSLRFPPVFEEASDFSGGSALVKLDGKYGCIKQNGRFMIAPEFDYLTQFHGDYAIAGRCVADGVLWYGLIDKHGNKVYPFCYDRIAYNDGRYVLTKNSRTIFLDENLKQLEIE